MGNTFNAGLCQTSSAARPKTKISLIWAAASFDSRQIPADRSGFPAGFLGLGRSPQQSSNSRKMRLPGLDDTCTLAHVFIFQTSLRAAAQNAGDCPFLMSLAGRMCKRRTCSSPKSGSENMPNSLNAMTTTKSEIINHAAKRLNGSTPMAVSLLTWATTRTQPTLSA